MRETLVKREKDKLEKGERKVIQKEKFREIYARNIGEKFRKSYYKILQRSKKYILEEEEK